MSQIAVWRHLEFDMEAAILYGKEKTGYPRYWIETRPVEDGRMEGLHFKNLANAIDLLMAMGYRKGGRDRR